MHRPDDADDRRADPADREMSGDGAVRNDQVTAALERLASGSFARCDLCGTQVDDRRLRVAPETDRCLRHRTVSLTPRQ